MQRLLVTAALVILASAPSTGAVGVFSDVVEHPLGGYIEYQYAKGNVEGYKDPYANSWVLPEFRPNAPINRAEFAKILNVMLDVDLTKLQPGKCFTDFTGFEQWYWGFACEAKTLGFLSGHPDGTFRGEDHINLAEALKMTVLAYDIPLPQYVQAPPNWYDPYFDAVASSKLFTIISGNPALPLSRAEAMALMTILDPTLASSDAYLENNTYALNPYVGTNTYGQYVPIFATPSTTCGNGIKEAGEQCDDGNNLNDDGCSAICYLVDQPVHHGALRLEERSLGSQTVTKGAQDVMLLHFDAVAGRQDVELTGVQFTAATGTLDMLENYRILADLDGDSVAEYQLAVADSDDDILSFNFNVIVKDGYYRRFAIIADVPTGFTSGDFALQFATHLPAYVQATNAIDGDDLYGITTNGSSCTESICWISVITDTARTLSVGSVGNLFVTDDSASIPSKLLTEGLLSDTIFQFKVLADNEDINLRDIAISGVPSAIESLSLYLVGTGSPFATAYSSSCDVPTAQVFCAQTDLVIQRDDQARIEVRAKVRDDLTGETSGQNVQLSLTAATTGQVAIQAQGVESQTDLAQNNGNSTAEGEVLIGRNTAGGNITITGPSHTVVSSSTFSITNSHGDANGSPIPVGISTFGQFRFGTNVSGSNFDVTLRSIVFTVNATNVEFDSNSIMLFNAANSNVVHPCSMSTVTGVITVSCTGLHTSAVSTSIDSGGAIDLALRGNIVNPQIGAGNSTLQAQISGFGSPSSPGAISWDDGSSVFDWIDINLSSVKSTLYQSN